jgi:hypothetical protein
VGESFVLRFLSEARIHSWAHGPHCSLTFPSPRGSLPQIVQVRRQSRPRKAFLALALWRMPEGSARSSLTPLEAARQWLDGRGGGGGGGGKKSSSTASEHPTVP